MKRELYNKVKIGSKVMVTIGIYNKGRICEVIHIEDKHVVLRSCDGKRFHGDRSLDCNLLILNMHDIDLCPED